jgi:hypothetical protein
MKSEVVEGNLVGNTRENKLAAMEFGGWIILK